MGKKENLYAREFFDYYINLGVDHLFIYDNNEPFSEKIQDVLDNKYKERITIYDTYKLNISCQQEVYNDCYQNNLKNYDWFIMNDMDEYLYIINDSLKSYLNNKIFDKCDFIKIHWPDSQDNNLIHYDPRPLLERFKKPYILQGFIKSIIRGNISDLKYWVHSPYISPRKNVTCTNDGKIINYQDMNFELIREINVNKSYFIHFVFKSTEEFINKYKRGYNNWFKKRIKKFLLGKVDTYIRENNITLQKLNYLEKELKLDLSFYKKNINKIKFQKLEKIF